MRLCAPKHPRNTLDDRVHRLVYTSQYSTVHINIADAARVQSNVVGSRVYGVGKKASCADLSCDELCETLHHKGHHLGLLDLAPRRHLCATRQRGRL